MLVVAAWVPPFRWLERVRWHRYEGQRWPRDGEARRHAVIPWSRVVRVGAEVVVRDGG